MEQTKALNALAPFLALTKSASSPRAAADLITRATSAPNTFVFAELLATPQIQTLANNAEYLSHLTLLKIFSYGTYSDYSTGSNLPTLNPAQTLKLRQLTFLTLAKTPSDLSYKHLQSALGLSNSRELEDVIISAIYAGLVTGTLDPYHQLVLVSSVAPLRDLPPNSIPAMLSSLNEWSERCVSTLADLERQIASIKSEALRRQRDEKDWNALVEKMIEAAGKETNVLNDQVSRGGTWANLGKRLGVSGGNSGAKRGGGAMDDESDDDMEVDSDNDEPEGRRGSRSAKKRGMANISFGK